MGVNQSISQSINQSINQLTNQSVVDFACVTDRECKCSYFTQIFQTIIMHFDLVKCFVMWASIILSKRCQTTPVNFLGCLYASDMCLPLRVCRYT